MINPDAGTAVQVDWPGYPPLMETDRGPILQIVRWNAEAGVWVRFVRRKGTVTEPGVVEKTPEDLLEEVLAGSGKGVSILR